MIEYNVRQHYENEHKAKFENLTGELRKTKTKHFLTLLYSQQNVSNIKIYEINHLHEQVI